MPFTYLFGFINFHNVYHILSCFIIFHPHRRLPHCCWLSGQRPGGFRAPRFSGWRVVHSSDLDTTNSANAFWRHSELIELYKMQKNVVQNHRASCFKMDAERLGIAFRSHGIALSWILLDSRVMSEPPPSTAWRPAGATQVPSDDTGWYIWNSDEFHRYPTSSNIFQHVETLKASSSQAYTMLYRYNYRVIPCCHWPRHRPTGSHLRTARSWKLRCDSWHFLPVEIEIC